MSTSPPPPSCVWLGTSQATLCSSPLLCGAVNSGVDIQLLGTGLHSENTQVSADHATQGLQENGALMSTLNERDGGRETWYPSLSSASRDTNGHSNSLVRAAPPSRPTWDLQRTCLIK